MKEFLDQNFLLSTGVSQQLYHTYAAGLPILDYHCHIDPRELWEDRRYENLTQLWLGSDHYKWRLMRSNGVEERYICWRNCLKQVTDRLPHIKIWPGLWEIPSITGVTWN